MVTKYTRQQQARAFAAGKVANACIVIALAVAIVFVGVLIASEWWKQ